jgi:hypothetical protein
MKIIVRLNTCLHSYIEKDKAEIKPVKIQRTNSTFENSYPQALISIFKRAIFIKTLVYYSNLN